MQIYAPAFNRHLPIDDLTPISNMEKALKEYKATLALDPSHTETFLQTGIIFYQQGNVQKAMMAWQEILKLKPDHAKAKQYISELQKKL